MGGAMDIFSGGMDIFMGKKAKNSILNAPQVQFNPEAYDDLMVPYFTDIFKQGIEGIGSRGVPGLDESTFANIRNQQMALADMMAKRALSGDTSMTNLAYDKAREDALTQGLALAATRRGNVGLNTRDLMLGNASFMQNAARERGMMGLDEQARNFNMGTESLSNLRNQDMAAYFRNRDANDALRQQYIAQFMNMQEAGRDARMERERMKLGPLFQNQMQQAGARAGAYRTFAGDVSQGLGKVTKGIGSLFSSISGGIM